jgi:Leucine-rich repeat (LRR) protein
MKFFRRAAPAPGPMKVVCTPPNQDQSLIRQWQTWANDPTVSNQQRDFRQVAARRVTNYRYHPHNEILDLSNLNLDGTLPPVPLTEKLMVHGNPGLTGIASLPPGLRLLSAGHCGLEQLPQLPETLEHLWVPKNPRIRTLPRLPNALKSLNVAHCGLRRLESFSDQSRLESLDVSDNQLGSLPSLPKHLSTLTAKGCGLTALPVITSSYGLTLDSRTIKLSISHNPCCLPAPTN